MNNKNFVIKFVYVFFLFFIASYLLTSFVQSDSNKILDTNFMLSQETCDDFNYVREFPPDKLSNLVVNESDNLIDIRTKTKFDSYSVPDSVNIPIWQTILDPNIHSSYLLNDSYTIVCNVNTENSWSEAHKVCNDYVRNLLYLFYDRINFSFLYHDNKEEQYNDEWEYYEIINKLDQDKNYIVFFEELNIDGSTFIDLERLDDINYLKNQLEENKFYEFICTNDFSCLHTWAVKEKLNSQGFHNLNSINKFIRLNENPS